MTFILTIVASDKPLSAGHLAGVERYLDSQGLALTGGPGWVEPHKAADLPLPQKPNKEQMATLRDALRTDRIDLFVNPVQNRRKKLLLADMDSTIIEGECLDELADRAGLKDKISAITARAMNGEIDFAAALTERVALLAGLPAMALDETLAAVKFNPGAEQLVRGMAGRGAICVLVSGGFTFFTEKIAARAGFHRHHGNVLEVTGGKLTGRVNGAILDKDAKLSFLQKYAAEAGLTSADVLAIGDGANDLPMLMEAGLGVGYRPKALLRESLDNCILYGDLSAALYAQGLNPAHLSAA